MRDEMVTSVIVTTHSPFVVEEAAYESVVLVRNQEFYFPGEHDEATRASINSALMSGRGAELMFARSVLLVEGEGDRQFFEALRRRLARVDERGLMDRLFVLSTGSNTQFGPWVQLLRSYGTSATRPIDWLVVADGDAATEVRDGLRAGGVTLPQQVVEALANVRQSGSLPDWENTVRQVNKVCDATELKLRLLPVDLESAALASASGKTVRRIAEKARWTSVGTDRASLLKKLGSKGVAVPAVGKKSPWIRRCIAEVIPWVEISKDINKVLKTWLLTVMSAPDATAKLAHDEL